MRRRFLAKKNKFYKTGVFVLNNDYKLYEIHNFNGVHNTVIGIAIITNDKAFMIAKTQAVNTWYYSNSITSLIPNCYATTIKSEAIKDFNGRQNSDSIVANDEKQASGTAARTCKSLLFNTNVTNGYCGSVGEYKIVYDHMTEIGVVLRRLNLPVLESTYWTSTQATINTAWAFDIKTGECFTIGKRMSNKTLALKEIPDKATYA